MALPHPGSPEGEKKCLCASSDPSQQQQLQQQQKSRPRTYSHPWNPNPFSASSGLENGNIGGEYDYQRQQLHRRGKQDANFACSVPGCGSTRGSEEQKQPMMQKRRQTGGAGGADITSGWILSDHFASFSDLAAVL